MTRDPARPRVVFVNRYYWPDELATAQLLSDLAEGLAGRGLEIMAIASRTRATVAREMRRNVEIVRVRATRWGRRSFAGKAVDYLTFAAAARRALRAQLQPGDWLVAMTDPPALAPLAATAARRARAPLAHWIQDIHPEISLALSGSGVLAQLSRRWMRRRDAAWRQADVCVPISNDMAAMVRDRGVPPERIRVIPNWAPGGDALAPVPPEQNPRRREWNLAGKFVVAYSGNLGRVHALEPVIAAAALLRDEPDLVFLFLGDGPRRPALEARARRLRLTNVQFRPAQPQARLAESLSVGDVHLVTLRPGCEHLVFPSKLYGILAVARPVVYVGPQAGELADAVRRAGAGLAVDAGDPAALATALRGLRADSARRAAMAEAAARWSRATGGLTAALAAWAELFAPR